MRTLSRLLDDTVDAAAIDGRRTIKSKAVAVVVVSLVLAANIGFVAAAGWFACTVAIDVFEHWLTGPQGATITNTLRRALYLGVICVSTLIWISAPVLFWLSRDFALQITAIIFLTAQLIHAQAFAFRAPIILAASGGIPAATLAVILLVYGEFRGLQLVTIVCALAMSLSYVAASARANILVARALRISQEELEQIAYLDALTALANRRMFTADFRRLLEFSHRHGTRFGLILVDLDGFKEINDTLGHDVGDAVLVEAALRLKIATKGAEVVARLGGDEFAILMSAVKDRSSVEAVCQRIVASFVDAVNFRGHSLQTSPSVGCALYPENGDEEDSLYKSADLALYDAKRGGRNTWRSYQAA